MARSRDGEQAGSALRGHVRPLVPVVALCALAAVSAALAQVVPSPVVIVVASATSGVAPLTVHLDASQSTSPDGLPIDVDWTFGDGERGSGLVVSHTYENGGSFTIDATVTNRGGSTAHAAVPIFVSPREIPRAHFEYGIGERPREYLFDASASTVARSIFSETWSFGDEGELVCVRSSPPASPTREGAALPSPPVGTRPGGGGGPPGSVPGTRPGSSPSDCAEPIRHVFAAPGDYEVTLTVTDDAGRSHAVTRTVRVLPSASLTLSALPGLTGGAPAGSRIFSADLTRALSGSGLTRLRAVFIHDTTPPAVATTAAPSPFAGQKIDAVILSPRRCNTASCAGFLVNDPSVGGWTASLRAGATPGFAPAPQFGSTEGRFDASIASLDALDANAARSSARGFLSLGFGGALLLTLPEAIDPADLWLYVGAVLDDAELSEYRAACLAFDEPPNLDELFTPGMLPVPGLAPSALVPAPIAAAAAAVDRGRGSLDLNGDGHADYTRAIDAAGRLRQAAIDRDGDGVREWVHSRGESGTVVLVDADDDGRIDGRWESKREGDASAVHAWTASRDSDRDGTIDRRVTFTVDAGSATTTAVIERDGDEDGSFDRVTSTNIPKTQLGLVFDDEESPCNPADRRTLTDSFQTALTRGLDCLLRLDEDLAVQFVRLCAEVDVVLRCGACPLGAAGCSSLDEQAAYLDGSRQPIHIKVSTIGPSSASIVFHELMHFIQGPHIYGDGTLDPRDPTYGCENTCFGPASNLSCAACMGTGPEDTRCDDFRREDPQCDLTKPVPTHCQCDDMVHPSRVECLVACSAGLQCLARGSECTPLGWCADP